MIYLIPRQNKNLEDLYKEVENAAKEKPEAVITEFLFLSMSFTEF